MPRKRMQSVQLLTACTAAIVVGALLIVSFPGTNSAANEMSSGNISDPTTAAEIVGLLVSPLEKVDGTSSPPDWMYESEGEQFIAVETLLQLVVISPE